MIIHGLDLNYLGINNVWNNDLGMSLFLGQAKQVTDSRQEKVCEVGKSAPMPFSLSVKLSLV